MILGCDAAGIDEDGNEVVVHAVISDPAGRGDERWTRAARCSPSATRAPSPSASPCPRGTSCRSPRSCRFEEAACLPTAWLTAYRMLFVQCGAQPGDTRAGAGRGRRRRDGADRAGRGRRAPGVGHAAATRPSGERALELGARRGVRDGRPAAARVDAVMETVGEATWSHSIKSLRPGGTWSSRGATSRRRPRRRRADPDLLPPAAGSSARRWARGTSSRRSSPMLDAPASARSSTARCRWSRPARGSRAMATGDLFGKVVFTR